jgi:hypothetical protein
MKHRILNALAWLVVLPLTLHAVSVGDYQVSQCTSASGSLPVWAIRTVTPAASAYSLAGFDTTKTPGNFTFGTGLTISGTGPNYVISATESPGGATWGDITGTLSNQTDLQTALNARAPATPGASGSVLYTVNPANTTTANLDSITATASTDLTLNAGSGNQNVNLLSSGTGNVIANLNGTSITPDTQGFIVVGPSGAVGIMAVYSYGGTAGQDFNRADGTPASPSAVASGDILYGVAVHPFDGSSYSSVAGLFNQAAENFGPSNHGSTWFLTAAPVGQATNSTVLLVNGNGKLQLSPPTGSNSSAWGTSGCSINVLGSVIRDNTSSGTVASAVATSFQSPTFSASSATTYTDAANVYIASGPSASTNVTITNRHALEVVGSISATSSITGLAVFASALGTAATSVGIGGGNVNAGGTIISGGQITSGAGITTAAGVTSAAGVWKLGALRSSTALVTSTTTVIQIDVGGTLYSLMTCATNP